jgi:hypothetical protein
MHGARKIPKELMKFNNELAEVRIFHGTIAHPPMMVIMIVPLLTLIHLGHKLTVSLAPLTTVAEILTHIRASSQLRPQKNAAALPPGPSHISLIEIGFHRYSPWTVLDAEVTTIPMTAIQLQIKGNQRPW